VEIAPNTTRLLSASVRTLNLAEYYIFLKKCYKSDFDYPVTYITYISRYKTLVVSALLAAIRALKTKVIYLTGLELKHFNTRSQVIIRIIYVGTSEEQ
jgi:hypothetical protein